MSVFFNSNSKAARLTAVEKELEELKRSFRTLQQEWDATADRVTKVLRRLLREKQAAEVVETGEDHGAEVLPSSPLTSIPTPPNRLDRIRQQLQARQGGK